MKPDSLYQLLPAVYRIRDAEQGYPLQALLRIMAEQFDYVEQDIAQLYENWFIETCDDWVVPYIGTLLGLDLEGDPRATAARQGKLRARLQPFLSGRQEVANTIRTRRRKGTLPLLEELARDLAGWPARAVEFQHLVCWTQAVNHVQPNLGRTANVRNVQAMANVDGPLDGTAHTIDVRRIQSRYTPGLYHPQNVGLFVWRLNPYRLSRAAVGGPNCLPCSPPFYTFSPVGHDVPLFHKGDAEADASQIAGERNLPVPIRLSTLRVPSENPGQRWRASSDFYGQGRSIEVWRKYENEEFHLVSCNHVVPHPLNCSRNIHAARGLLKHLGRGFVAVDPETGRLALSPCAAPQELQVTFHYGFSADLGGGEYDRPLAPCLERRTYFVSDPENLAVVLQAAREVTVKSEGEGTTIFVRESLALEISDNLTYQVPPGTRICIAAGQTLEFRATNGRRPHVVVDGRLEIALRTGSRFELNGVVVQGGPIAADAVDPDSPATANKLPRQSLPSIVIQDTTLVPQDHASLQVSGAADVQIDCSIVGRIEVSQPACCTPVRRHVALSFVTQLHLRDSIVDAAGRPVCERPRECDVPECPQEDITCDDVPRFAVRSVCCTAAQARISVERCTILGRVSVHQLSEAQDTIFDGLVCVTQQNQGCLRFCYLPPGSQTPRRYQCKGATALSESGNGSAQHAAPSSADVRPVFASRRYGTPDYCQLLPSTSVKITRGAEDGSEMGVFHDLFQPQRADRLTKRLQQYTPASMKSRVFFVT